MNAVGSIQAKWACRWVVDVGARHISLLRAATLQNSTTVRAIRSACPRSPSAGGGRLVETRRLAQLVTALRVWNRRSGQWTSLLTTS